MTTDDMIYWARYCAEREGVETRDMEEWRMYCAERKTENETVRYTFADPQAYPTPREFTHEHTPIYEPLILEPICECGGEKCKVPHLSWCPKYSR